MSGQKNIRSDVGQCIGFYTRIPVTHGDDPGDFARAQWAAPLVGGLVGTVGAFVFYLADLGGLSVTLAAILTLCATILLTGALHEDGLADVADGFGGGDSVERKLEIMRDSRVGTYGVLALIAGFSIRSFALMEIANPIHVAGAIIAAHTASRAILPAFMRTLEPARSDGLGKGVGRVPDGSVFVALIFGAAGLALAGPMAAIISALVLVLWFAGLRLLTKTQINGYTGDVLGALQQGGEAIVLIVATVWMV